MSVGRKLSKHAVQLPCGTTEETEAHREEGRFLALPTLSVRSQGWDAGRQLSSRLASPPTPSTC